MPKKPALTFVENAMLKARHAARLSGLPALGDDSGICVDALKRRARAVLGTLRGSARRRRREYRQAARSVARRAAIHSARAHFHCTLVLLRHADDPAPLIAEGRWHGRILHAPRGDRGFGYDPVFFDPAHGAAGELDPALKNRVSHRGLALARLRGMLKAAA